MDLIFLDTETTGNDVTKDRLCQVCYKTSQGTKVEYFKPPIPLSVKAMSITHITNKMLLDKPAFVGSDMYKDLLGLLEGGILVAHNAEFDCAILENEGIKIPRKICTLRLARYLDERGDIPEYNLQYLRYFYDLDVVGTPHDAEGDVNVLYSLFQKLFSQIKNKFPRENEATEEAMRISNAPILFRRLSFGKYKDVLIDEVLKSDRGYLEWLLREKLKSGEKDPDWIYTLQEVLK
ncbi:MAG: 3'-5' exonuclease [Candidatus Vogelbacteria bacterium]|nr:3'-5' exonuclease [Candidatus Vogelbacteria bacterium]